MTKKEYIDFIRNSLPTVDKTSRFHPEQVAAAINVAVNTIFHDMYAKNPKGARKSLERYSNSLTNLTVSAAIGSSRYTSTVAFDIMDLPTKASGILEIVAADSGSPQLNATTKFVPVTAIEGRQFYGSEASLPGNVIGYTWAGNKTIEYWNMDATTAAAGVLARIIKPFKAYSSTDTFIPPYGQDQQIIAIVREYLGVTPLKDTINNNSDIKVNG